MTALVAAEFQLWDQPAPGGTILWSEAHDGTTLPKVQIRNGVLAVVLGQLTPLEPAVLGSGVSDRWIAVVVAGDELARVKLTASAFSVSAASAGGIWNPSSGTVVDLAGLDARYVRSTGTGGNVLRTVNGIAPGATGDFSLEAGANVTLTPTANGLRIAAAGEAPGAAVRTVNGVSPDATGAFQVAAGSNVTVTATANGIQISAAGAPIGTVVRSISGVSPDGAGSFTLSAGSNVTITPTANGLQISAAAGGGLDVGTADGRYLNSGFSDSGVGINLSQDLIANGFVRTNTALQIGDSGFIQHSGGGSNMFFMGSGLNVAGNFTASGMKSFVVPEKVVETERRTGHKRLAEELESLLRQPKRRGTAKNGGEHALQELPQSRRHGEQLATVIPRDELEHHMVLPTATEERFARIECEFAARERLEAYGLKARKRILLHGLPGCGKSLGAKRLAWNTGMPLMKVRFDALISSYFGESAANLRSIFTAAKERPCVLLLDECDFIARSRVNGKDIGEASRILEVLGGLRSPTSASAVLGVSARAPPRNPAAARSGGQGVASS